MPIGTPKRMIDVVPPMYLTSDILHAYNLYYCDGVLFTQQDYPFDKPCKGRFKANSECQSARCQSMRNLVGKYVYHIQHGAIRRITIESINTTIATNSYCNANDYTYEPTRDGHHGKTSKHISLWLSARMDIGCYTCAMEKYQNSRYFTCTICAFVSTTRAFVYQSSTAGMNIACQRCAQKNFYKCNHCEKLRIAPAVSGQDRCEHCNAVSAHSVGISDGINYFVPELQLSNNIRTLARPDYAQIPPNTPLAGVFTQPAYPQEFQIHEYGYKPEAIFHHAEEPLTSPKRGKLYLGMELEVEMKQQYSTLTRDIAGRFSKDVSGIAYCKKDSSIANGFEIVSHPAEFDWWEKKGNKLLASISKLTATCESYWSHSTGIHIHMSKSAFTNLQIAKFCYFLINNQSLATTIAERYNKEQAPFSWGVDMLESAVKHNGDGINRHNAINLLPPQTIEVRLFKGNMSKVRILKNIEFLVALYDFTKSNESGGLPPKNPGIAWSLADMEKYDSYLTAQTYKKFVDDNAKKYPHLAAYIKKYKGED